MILWGTTSQYPDPPSPMHLMKNSCSPDIIQLATIFYFMMFRTSRFHSSIFHFPWLIKFSNIWWFTLSNAFAKSKLTMSVLKPLGLPKTNNYNAATDTFEYSILTQTHTSYGLGGHYPWKWSLKENIVKYIKKYTAIIQCIYRNCMFLVLIWKDVDFFIYIHFKSLFFKLNIHVTQGSWKIWSWENIEISVNVREILIYRVFFISYELNA